MEATSAGPTFGPLCLDLQNVSLCNSETGLTSRMYPKEYQMLWLLMRANGGWVPTKTLCNFMFDRAAEPPVLQNEYRNFYSVMQRVRMHLVDVSNQRITIHTMREYGYSIGWV